MKVRFDLELHLEDNYCNYSKYCNKGISPSTQKASQFAADDGVTAPGKPPHVSEELERGALHLHLHQIRLSRHTEGAAVHRSLLWDLWFVLCVWIVFIPVSYVTLYLRQNWFLRTSCAFLVLVFRIVLFY